MFHQLEALVVDKNVTMVDLKSTVMQFVHAYFGPRDEGAVPPELLPVHRAVGRGGRLVRGQAEVDRARRLRDGPSERASRPAASTPRVYSGWAFGFGIERIAMRKYGINDIRHFIENDVRFLRQF